MLYARIIAAFVAVFLLLAWAVMHARAEGAGAGAQSGASTQSPAPASPVQVQTFPVPLSAQDGGNVNQLCTYAIDSPQVNLATKTAIGQFCLDLLNRIGLAQKGAQGGASTTNEAVKNPASGESVQAPGENK